jgi:MoxR-like ATPase
LNKWQELIKGLNSQFWEREQVVKGLVASLITGLPALLIGEPGTGKSYLLNTIASCFTDATYFTKLLNKSISPDEVLGGISLKALEERDLLIRNTQYRLPTAHLAFIDEVFRANNTVLDSLLKIINEGVFENPEPKSVPLCWFCGATNFLDDSEHNEAFLDRFIYRPFVFRIKQKKNLKQLLSGKVQPTTLPCFTLAELETAKQESLLVNISDTMLDTFINVIEILVQETGFTKISDRRTEKILKLWQTYAYINGQPLNYTDLRDLLPSCVATTPEEVNTINKVLNMMIPDGVQEAKILYIKATELFAELLNAHKTGMSGEYQGLLRQLMVIRDGYDDLVGDDTNIEAYRNKVVNLYQQALDLTN